MRPLYRTGRKSMSKRYRSLILILSIAVMVFLSGYAVQPVYADETDNNPTVEENGGSNNSEPAPGPSSGGDSGSSSDSGGGSDSGSGSGDATPSDSGGSGSGSGGESSGGGDTNTGGESTPGGGTNTGGENTPGDDNTPGDENTPGDQPSAGGENTPGEGTTPGGTTGDNSGQSGQNNQSGSGTTTESSTVLKESKPSQDITDLPATVDPGSATLKETAKSGSDSNTAAGTKYTNSADAISPAQATSGLGTEAGKDGNAIQRAVTAALKNATAETTVITVTVDEGEYNGDIKIAKPEASTEGESSQAVSLNSDLKVYILGKGSYTEPESGMIDKTKITAGAGANARVNGNILIDGINVVLAGLYYSLETKINVKNADATIYGTKSEDNITVNLDGKSTTTIDGGDASDIITLTGNRKESGQAATLKGGNGDDIYNVKLIDKTAEEPAPQDQQSGGGQNTDGQNTDDQNPDDQNTDDQNPDDQNTDDQNPDDQNPDDQNTDDQNPDDQNTDDQNDDDLNNDDQNVDDQNDDDQNTDDQNTDDPAGADDEEGGQGTEGGSGSEGQGSQEGGEGQGGQSGQEGGEGQEGQGGQQQDQQPATITSNITIEDSDKYGILVLDGKLSTTAENRLKVEEANGTYTITAINEAGHTTVIKATGLKGLSDTLTNKETVEVSVGEGFLKTIELEPYKDYVVKSLLLPEITAKKKDSSATLYFTNVVLTYDDWISKVAKKDLDFKFLDTWGANVPDANVLIKGRDIRIRGNIKAKIVNIIAEDKTEEITDVYSKTNDGDMFDLWTNVWNMYRGSSIKVMEKVTVEAEYVLMNVTQTADISKTIGLMQKHQSGTEYLRQRCWS